MKKGFGETVPSGIEASLIRQLVRPCQLVLNEQQEDAEFMFYTTKKRLSSLRKVVHSLAQQYPQLFFRVVLFEGSNSHFGKNRLQKASKDSIAHERIGFLGTQIRQIVIIILIMRIAGLKVLPLHALPRNASVRKAILILG